MTGIKTTKCRCRSDADEEAKMRMVPETSSGRRQFVTNLEDAPAFVSVDGMDQMS